MVMSYPQRVVYLKWLEIMSPSQKRKMFFICVLVGLVALSQQYSRKSELRPGYGLLYNYQGQILPNVNSYWLVTGIEIPKPYFPEPLSFDIVCDHLGPNVLATEICTLVQPIAEDFRQKQEKYHKKIQRIIMKDIPALMPNYKFDENSRRKRDTSQDPEYSGDEYLTKIQAMADLDESLLDDEVYYTTSQKEVEMDPSDVLLLPPPLIEILRRYNITLFDDLPSIYTGAIILPPIDPDNTTDTEQNNKTVAGGWEEVVIINRVENIMRDERVAEGTQKIVQHEPVELFMYSESPALYETPSTSIASRMAPNIISSLQDGIGHLVTRAKRYLNIVLPKPMISQAITPEIQDKIEIGTRMGIREDTVTPTVKSSIASNLRRLLMIHEQSTKRDPCNKGNNITLSNQTHSEITYVITRENRFLIKIKKLLTKYNLIKMGNPGEIEQVLTKEKHFLKSLLELLGRHNYTMDETNETISRPPDGTEYAITRERRFLVKLMKLLTRHNVTVTSIFDKTSSSRPILPRDIGQVMDSEMLFLKALMKLFRKHNITVEATIKNIAPQLPRISCTSAASRGLPTILLSITDGIASVTNGIVQGVSRVKRQIGMVLGQVAKFIVGGVNMYLNYKKETVMKQSISLLQNEMKDQKHKIVALKDTMTSIAKTAFHKIRILWTSIVRTNKELEKTVAQLHDLKRSFVRMNTKVQDNRQAIRVLAYIVGRFYEATFSILHYYDRLLTELYHKLDGLETLATGRLSHSLIEPEQLKHMLKFVEEDLQDNYVEYELAIKEINIYYDLPSVSYTMIKDMIVIQIPIYIKHYNSEKLDLFHVTSIPVPFHADMQYPEANGHQPYTWIVPKHDMLAMSENKYMSVKSEEIQYCKKIADTYYCENLLLVTHKSRHTCESAIYWNATLDVIQENCDIEYAHEYLPQPQILDTGELLLLAGIPGPWSIFCNAAQEIPVQIQAGPYVLIKRKYLCLCAISAGPYYLQETISSCSDDPDLQTRKGDNFHYLYTINTAVAEAFGTTIPQISAGVTSDIENSPSELMIELRNELVKLSDKILTDKPIEITIADCQIHETDDDEENVLNTDMFDEFIDFEPVFEAIKNNEELYMNAEDKAADMAEISSWFSHYVWFALMFLLSIAGTIGLILALYALGRLIVVKGIMTNLNAGLTKIVTTMIPLGLPKPAEAIPPEETIMACDYNTILNWKFLGLLIGWEVLALIVLGIFYWISKLVVKYWQQENTVLPSTFLGKECCPNIGGNDVSEVYIELSSIEERDVIRLYVSTVLGTPVEYTQKGTLKGPDVSYKTGLITDYLYVEWNRINIWCGNELIYLPRAIVVSIFSRGRIKTILQAEDVKSRIIMESHNKYHVLIAGDEFETTEYQTSVGNVSIMSQVAQFVERSQQVTDLDADSSDEEMLENTPIAGTEQARSERRPESGDVAVTRTMVSTTQTRPPFLDEAKPRIITCSFCNNKLYV